VTRRLMRTWYGTDADDSTVGAFSNPLPDIPFRDGWQIVAVDWSRRGEVEVTWLLPPGEGG